MGSCGFEIRRGRKPASQKVTERDGAVLLAMDITRFVVSAARGSRVGSAARQSYSKCLV